MTAAIEHFDLSRLADATRERMGLGLDQCFDGGEVTQYEKSLTLIERPFGPKVCGVIFKGETESAIIAANSHLPNWQFHFTVAHELFHYVSAPKIFRATDTSLEACAKRKTEDKRADDFAEWFLMPHTSFWKYFVNEANQETSLAQILRIGNHFNAHYSLVIKRLKQERLLPEDFPLPSQEEVLSCLKENGLSPVLYQIRHDDDQPHVQGRYVELAHELYKKDRIGESKREELLRAIK